MPHSPLQQLWAHHFPSREWPGEMPAAVYVFNKVNELQAIVSSLRETLPPMRTREEVQRAHDVLVQLMGNEDLAEIIDPALMDSLSLRLDILCWVLMHDHIVGFADVMTAIDDAFATIGIVVGRYEVMQQRREPHE